MIHWRLILIHKVLILLIHILGLRHIFVLRLRFLCRVPVLTVYKVIATNWAHLVFALLCFTRLSLLEQSLNHLILAFLLLIAISRCRMFAWKRETLISLYLINHAVLIQIGLNDLSRVSHCVNVGVLAIIDGYTLHKVNLSTTNTIFVTWLDTEPYKLSPFLSFLLKLL